MDRDADTVATHRWKISDREYARHEARRGRRHAYDTLCPTTTALVTIDMVPFFLAESAYARGVVANINHLAEVVRAGGGTVAWVLPRAGPPSEWETGFFAPTVAAAYAASGGTAELRRRLWPELAALQSDLWVEKSAASAFFPGRCPLPDELAARHIDTVLITGTVTSVCCESSARDAATLAYRVIVIADATADSSDEAHNAALRTIYRSFGDVRPTAEVIGLLSTRSL